MKQVKDCCWCPHLDERISRFQAELRDRGGQGTSGPADAGCRARAYIASAFNEGFFEAFGVQLVKSLHDLGLLRSSVLFADDAPAYALLTRHALARQATLVYAPGVASNVSSALAGNSIANNSSSSSSRRSPAQPTQPAPQPQLPPQQAPPMYNTQQHPPPQQQAAPTPRLLRKDYRFKVRRRSRKKQQPKQRTTD